MLKFIINTFYFNLSLVTKLSREGAQAQLEKMYQEFESNTLNADDYSEELLTAFQYYLENREVLCLTP